jgi:CubicO group peptidase (beta-lactamase class C family)
MRHPSPSPVASALQPFVDKGWIAGAVLLVADKDRVLSVDAVGWADLARRRPMRPDTLFWIASITKPITGAAFMMLVDEGKVRPSDPVEKHLPEFADLRVAASRTKARAVLVRPRRKLTLRHALSHMGGMPFASPLEKPTLDRLPLEVAVRSHAITPLDAHPGRRYAYSNAGINTAARVLEVASGVPYAEFLASRLLRPLGMRDATFVPTRAQLARLATPHRPDPARKRYVATRIGQLAYPLDNPSRQPMPAGGLFATARDVARFAQMVLRGGALGGKRYLSRAAVREMTRRCTPPGSEKGYGLGWLSEKDFYGHGGALGSMMKIHRRSGLITVFLGQHAGWIGDGEKAIATFENAALAAHAARP